ncbi:4Fe-4S binding protein [candidate division FCPU426 bacterium]|nr:4Fe-4S binding protein [candidate division FCPU426 bacterium]
MGKLRKIITIAEDKCTGCGLCIPNCPEGALQIIDNKARLISDLFCDGLGACIGHCPEGAIRMEEREAQPYNEAKVMANIVKQGANTIAAHLRHLQEHGAEELYSQAVAYLKENKIPLPTDSSNGHGHGHSCPGARALSIKAEPIPAGATGNRMEAVSQLQNWPVQLKLLPVYAPYLKQAEVLLAADCAPFAYAAFHQDFLQGKVLMIACPKLDDTQLYIDKLTAIFKTQDIRSLTIVHMQVPCCFGLVEIVQAAQAAAGVRVRIKRVNISLQGQVLEEAMA